jgi:hypothetical protein
MILPRAEMRKPAPPDAETAAAAMAPAEPESEQVVLEQAA